MSRLHLLVVDDSALVRKLLTEVLSEQPDFEIVATAANGREALSRLDEHEIDALILDLHMPVMGGMELLEALDERAPDIGIILFSSTTSLCSGWRPPRHISVSRRRTPGLKTPR